MANKKTKWKNQDVEWLEIPTITAEKRYKVRTRQSQPLVRWDSNIWVVLIQIVAFIVAFYWAYNYI